MKVYIAIWNNTEVETKARANGVSFWRQPRSTFRGKSPVEIIRNYRCQVETNYAVKMKTLCFKFYQKPKLCRLLT